MNLTDLHTFALVAETGSITGAAKRLGVPKSTVSRRVRRLEGQLGHDLLRRSSRAVALTERGQTLFQRSESALLDLQAAMDALAHADREPMGTLRLSTVPGFGQSRAFIACLDSYASKYPKTNVELHLSPRMVNLIDESFDLALRLHSGPLPDDSTLTSRSLMHVSRAMYASPAYLREHGTPKTLDDLAGHRIAAHSIVDQQAGRWKHPASVKPMKGRFPQPLWIVNDSTALERIATAGAGLALLMTLEGDHLAEQGVLERVLPRYEARGSTASLVWPTSRHLAPRVRAFIDHAVEVFAS